MVEGYSLGEFGVDIEAYFLMGANECALLAEYFKLLGGGNGDGGLHDGEDMPRRTLVIDRDYEMFDI